MTFCSSSLSWRRSPEKRGVLAELSGFSPASSQQEEEVVGDGEVRVRVSAEDGSLTRRAVTVGLSEVSDADTDLESLQPHPRPKRELPLGLLAIPGDIFLSRTAVLRSMRSIIAQARTKSPAL